MDVWLPACEPLKPGCPLVLCVELTLQVLLSIGDNPLRCAAFHSSTSFGVNCFAFAYSILGYNFGLMSAQGSAGHANVRCEGIQCTGIKAMPHRAHIRHCLQRPMQQGPFSRDPISSARQACQRDPCSFGRSSRSDARGGPRASHAEWASRKLHNPMKWSRKLVPWVTVSYCSVTTNSYASVSTAKGWLL